MFPAASTAMPLICRKASATTCQLAGGWAVDNVVAVGTTGASARYGLHIHATTAMARMRTPTVTATTPRRAERTCGVSAFAGVAAETADSTVRDSGGVGVVPSMYA